MTWSLNELEAETKKAIRGAGLSWGLSEDGAKAVRWLAAHGIDPLPALDDVLARHDRRAIATELKYTETGRLRAGSPICPIVLGATLSDHAYHLLAHTFTAGPVAQSVLLIPFVAGAARFLKRTLRLDLDGMQLVLTEIGDPVGDLSAVGAGNLPEVRCQILTGRLPLSSPRPASSAGIDVDPNSWSRLSAYVHRTYVPASERSRREGAGAGLIDND
ncbi:MAG: DUF3726 domain-containing protein [Pseudorhodoplanes sp.]